MSSSSTTSISPIPSYIAAGRFANNNDDNHAGAIWISTLLCLVYSTLVLIIRAHLRWNVYSLDDYVILAATVLQTGEVVSLIIALQHGLGQSQSLSTPEQINTANTGTFLGMIFFIASTCTAKLSVILLMMRLFNLNGSRSLPDSRNRILWSTCFAAAIIISVWGVGSIIGLSLNCTITSLLSKDSSILCPQQALRWDVIGTIDALTELLLVVLATITVYPVQLPLKRKIPIVLAFSFRLPSAALSILHITYIHALSASSNPSLAIVPVLVTMQVQQSWSILSATIPNMKSFVRSFNTFFDLGFDLDNSGKWGSASRSRSVGTITMRKGTIGNGEEEYMHELSRIRTLSHSHSHSQAQARPSSIATTVVNRTPQRPSRTDVDLEGIGRHGGIPAIPGFGARESRTVGCGVELDAGYRGDMSTGPGGIIDEGEMSGRDGCHSVDSRECIIRKDMFEARYEMI